jgi:hypothetical protein
VRWPLLSPEELISAPPAAWLIKDYLIENEFSQIYGRWGCGKSFLALAWACSIATGTPWFERDVKKGPVLFIAPEGGKGGWGKRLKAWAAHCGVPVKWDNLRFIRVPVNFYKQEEDALLQELKRINAFGGRDPIFTVIDTQARAMVGADEDSAKDMGLFVAAVNNLQTQTGSHVCSIHHTPKEAADARGSGAQHGALDAQYYIEKAASMVTLECVKVKDGEHLPPLPMQLVKMPGTGSCVLLPPAVSGLKKNSRKLLELVSSSQIPVGTSLGKWGEEHDMNHSTAYRSQDELLAGGYVTQTDGIWTLTSLAELALSQPSQLVPA